jgi:acetyl esterase/lipase
MLAKDFGNLPPTHIITAEFDICRDEAHRYAELLAKSGNKVTQKCYTGMPHAFGHYTDPQKGLSKGREYIDDTCEVLRRAHNMCGPRAGDA